MLALEAPHQPLPDNVWHTLLITALATAFLWLGWAEGLAQFRSGEAVTLGEQLLRTGSGVHPLYLALEKVTDPQTPWMWNRIVSALGWIFTLILVIRLLTRLAGFLASLPSFLLLATLPGLSLRMCAGASGSFGAWFFLLAFSALLLEEDSGAWLRGGIYAALAIALDLQWLLPAAGLMLGLWELNRDRLPRAALGLASGLGTAVLLLALFSPSAFASLLPRAPMELPIETILRRHPLLLAAFLMMLVYGFRRRGLLWWCLVFSLPSAFFPAARLPFLLLFFLGIARWPGLIGVSHPRVYQTVLLCQFLLWLPSFL